MIMSGVEDEKSHDQGGHSRGGSRRGAQQERAGRGGVPRHPLQPCQVSGQSRGDGSGVGQAGAGQEYGSHNRQGMTERQLLHQEKIEDYHKRKITEIMDSLPVEFLNQIKQKLQNRNIRPGHPKYERYVEKARMKQAKYIYMHKHRIRILPARIQSGVSSDQCYRSIEEIPNPYRLPSTIEELKKAAERYGRAKSMVHSLPKQFSEKYTEEQWHEYCKQHYTKKYNAVIHRLKAIRQVTAQMQQQGQQGEQGEQSHQHHHDQQGHVQVTGHGHVRKQSGYHHSNDPSTNGTNDDGNGSGAARGTTTTIGTKSLSASGNDTSGGTSGGTSGTGGTGGTN